MSGATRDFSTAGGDSPLAGGYTGQVLSETQMNALEVKTGELYEFTFRPNWFVNLVTTEGLRKSLCEAVVKHDPHFDIINSYTNELNGEIIVLTQVRDNPLPFVVVYGLWVAGGAAVLLSALGLTVWQVRKLVKTPEGAAAVSNISTTALLIGAGYLLTQVKGILK